MPRGMRGVSLIALLATALAAATPALAGRQPTPAQWSAAYAQCEEADYTHGRLPVAKALAAFGRNYRAVLRAENALVPAGVGAKRYDDVFNRLSAPFGAQGPLAWTRDLSAPAKEPVWADFCGDIYQRNAATSARARTVELAEIRRLAAAAAQLPGEVARFDAVLTPLETDADPFLAQFATRLASTSAPLAGEASALVLKIAAWKRNLAAVRIP